MALEIAELDKIVFPIEVRRLRDNIDAVKYSQGAKGVVRPNNNYLAGSVFKIKGRHRYMDAYVYDQRGYTHYAGYLEKAPVKQQ